MPILKYKYNTTKLKKRSFIAVRYFLLWIISVLIINLLYSYRVNTPKTISFIEENEALLSKLTLLNNNLKSLNKELNILNRRDSGTYRMAFGMEKHKSVNSDLPTIISDDYNIFKDRYSDVITDTWKLLQRNKIEVVNCSVSFDTIEYIASQRINMTRSIPAIWPINVKDFSGRLCPFGWRMHPILNRLIEHSGLDLGCKTGTSVYAPADGVVRFVRSGWNGGYGTEILISHGMGYQTRYAHLSKTLVRPGESVKRGDKIALSGNTGRSTGAHLHYEVIYRNKPVNPLNYFRKDQTKEDFSRILENAKEYTFENNEEAKK